MFVMLYWQLAPVISARFGASLDLRKLLAYPIPHGSLFFVEMLLRVTNCAEMLMHRRRRGHRTIAKSVYGWRAAPYIVPGALLFAAMNILLSAGTRNWFERLFHRTHLKEAVIFLFVLAGFCRSSWSS